MIGYLGLGCNVGDRLANLQGAVASLRQHGIEILAASSVYETEPVGLVLDQPDFYNACLRIETAADPEELLDVAKAVERELGRGSSGPRHGPRPIDIDVLILGELQHQSERLTLPHAEVTSRRFVLVPLLELDPELRLPDGTDLRQTLEALGPGQEVGRVAGPDSILPNTSRPPQAGGPRPS